MKSKRRRYQEGSITRIKLASGGYSWRVRFSQSKNGLRTLRSMTFSGRDYPKESDVRKAIELEVIKQNRTTERHKVDAAFSSLIDLYKAEHIPELEFTTQELYVYVLRKYVAAEFGDSLIRDVTPLRVKQWMNGLALAPSTKATTRTVMRQIFELAALHGYVSSMERNPMSLVKLKGVSKRKNPFSRSPLSSFRRW